MTRPEKNSRVNTAALIEERLRLWFAGSPQGPVVLELFPSARCNLNCIFCRRSDHYPLFKEHNSEVPDAKYRALIEEGIALGVREVTFKGGGEPLMRRGLVEFSAPRFARAGVNGLMVTNGTLLDEELAALLVAQAWAEVTISLDAPDAATHDHIRQKPGTFALALKAARRLAEAKVRAGVASPVIKFHAVLTNLNAARIGELISLAADCGVNAFELDSLDASEPSAGELKLSQADTTAFEAALEDGIALAKKLGVTVNLAAFRKSAYIDRHAPRPGTPPCLYPWFQVSVQANGSLVPCCVAGMRSDGGRMHELSLEDAWFKKDMREIRAAFTGGSRPAFCVHCSPLQLSLNAELFARLSADTPMEHDK